jgi:hypothetical protein
VLLPGGESAAKATVLLCTPRAGVTIDGPAHVKGGINTTKYLSQTDEAGRFSLAPAIAPQGLIIIHDRGYAEFSLADLEARGNIVTLEPWGRVEGKLTLDSRPAANERVVAGNHVARYDDDGRRFGFMSFYLEAKTDPAGRFCFDKVPPGQCRIFRQQLLSRTGFESHDTSVRVNAGQVTEVVLGGTGRSITGKAILPGATRSIDWKAVAVRLRLKTVQPLGSRPKRAEFSSTHAYIAAADRFFEAAAAEKRFGALCDSNGSFRVPDVPAGAYELEIKVRDFKHDSASPHDLSDPAPEIGSLVREVVVPEIDGGKSEESLDLGILELAPQQDSAPAHPQ